MRHFTALALGATVLALAPAAAGAQAMDPSRAVDGGGIHVPGWMGKVDANEAAAGLSINSAKFMQMGNMLHVTTGPAITYWNPANTATGEYTVKATFNEPKYMATSVTEALNSHPHPYGIVIAGNDMGTDQQSYMYCSAYGNGTFIVRGFGGTTPFQVNEPPASGGRAGRATPPAPHEAVNKAAGPREPVTQEIALSVKSDRVECIINGKVVGSYPKANLVAAGRLKSTDGVYGIRFAHNTEAMVTGLAVTKP